MHEPNPAEPAGRERDDRFRTLVDNLVQAVFLKDDDLRFIGVNRRFCEELGLAEADILGRSDLDLYPADLARRYRADDRRVLAGARIEHEEANVAQGRERRVHVVKTPVRDAAGRVTGVLGIFWDVTDQHRLEEQLRQAHKMEAVGQLAGGVAHDFNNLLTGILGHVSLARTQLPADSPIKELLATAEQAAWRAATLTSQLLGFSRQTMLRPEPLVLNRTVEEVVGLLRRTLDPRILLRTSPALDLWTVQADPGQMGQVLMNLCLNGRDALHDVLDRPDYPDLPRGEATLMIATANVELDEAAVGREHPAGRPGQYVLLQVADTGCGIPAHVRARIFEPFFTTKGPGKGTGLGLAMVFGIVQQHRGWVECHSTVGEGTAFEIYLPRTTATATPTMPPPSPPPSGGTETILFADDEAALRSLGQTILRKQGYQVLLAEDGEQAVETYRRRQGEIGLVILDMTMPRLSGREALREIRQINPAARVVLTSGYSADSLSEENRREIQGFLPKPFRPDGLARAVREALDAPSSSQKSEVRSEDPGFLLTSDF